MVLIILRLVDIVLTSTTPCTAVDAIKISLTFLQSGVIDREGKEQDWNLINRFKTNTLPLPDRVDGEACNTYLQRKDSWKSIKKMMKETQGMNIVAYSFRHSYSLRAHVLGIDSGSVSMSMGHTLEAHHRAYPYASKASTTNAFKRARERAKA